MNATLNAPAAYDVGYRIENEQSCFFVLDDQGNEVHKLVGHTGPYICSDEELQIKDWCRARGAAVNYLPSWLHHSEAVSLSVMRMFDL